MIRRIFVIGVLALVIIAVVVDRLADSAAERAVAVKIRQAALLQSDPTVHIDGFPFLTQALGGKYSKITVTAHGISRGGVRIDTVSAAFSGVHISLGAALAGRVNNVPIDSGVGSITFTYADLNSFTRKRQIVLAQDGTGLRITGNPSLGSARAHVTGTATVAVSGTDVTLTPVASSLRGPSGRLPAAQAAAVARTLTTVVNTGRLPFGLQIQTASVTPAGIVIDAAAKGLTVPVPADASTP